MALNAGEQLSGGEVVDASGRLVVAAATLPPGAGGINDRGAWAATTAYAKADSFTNGGLRYYVETAYTSAGSFGSSDTTNSIILGAQTAGGGAPSGSAGGDLSGTYPNPGVANLNGVAAALYALLASPAFTGNPTVPTQTAGNNSTRAASTAYVDATAHGNGIVTKSANYTLLNTDTGVQVTATATITLPASPFVGRPYHVKNFGAGVTVTVSTGGANKIDTGGTVNATSMTFNTQGTSYTYMLAANGTDWLIV